MVGRGYYRMARGWMEHEAFASEPFTQREAWLWMIENAAYAGHRQRIGSQIIDLQRGQVAASTRYLGKAWQWDEKKVRRFLARLKTASMIAADAAAGITVITICNYDVYQAGLEDSAAPSAADTAAEAPHQRRKIERKKESNIDSIDHRQVNQGGKLLGLESKSTVEIETFETWWTQVPRKVGKGQARRAFQAALKKTSFGVLVESIRRYAMSVEGTDPRYIKHPTTWLNGECWLDDLQAGEPQALTTEDRQTNADFERDYQTVRAKGTDSPEFAAFIAKHRNGANHAIGHQMSEEARYDQ